jgi:aryl-alcohol dehydrogenase-like predicted oxidoreductase
MRYRTLGRTGIKVSPYALGAMMFGAIGNPDHVAGRVQDRRAALRGVEALAGAAIGAGHGYTLPVLVRYGH